MTEWELKELRANIAILITGLVDNKVSTKVFPTSDIFKLADQILAIVDKYYKNLYNK